MIKKISCTLLMLVGCCCTYAQTTIPQNYFRSPLGIPLFLAGNFGELRSNHFHGGLDMKTRGRQGYRVYAAADGFVSRIKVSPWGYGKTIYIDHPNGTTTVYAHLQQFKGEIAQEVKKHQYRNESWEMNWYPPDTLLPVKKGDVIALSGNTGGSSGPHLHFEIRETVSENPINPLLVGFDIQDNIKPLIKSIVVSPLNDTSYVNQSNEPQRFLVVGSNGDYQLKYGTSISAYGEIGIGIETIDKLNGVSNRNGIYSITLMEDSTIIYQSEMKKFSFEQDRALNSLIDYRFFMTQKVRYQKSYIEPNNQLQIYTQHKNRGVVSFAASHKKNYMYAVKDTYGNLAQLTFSIQGRYYKNLANASQQKMYDTLFSYQDSNYFKKENIRVSIPKDALYKDLPFQFSTAAQLSNTVSPLYFLHNAYEPLHKAVDVAIKMEGLTLLEKSKATVVRFDHRQKFSALASVWKGNFMTASSKKWGGFAVMLDTIPPKIKPVNLFKNKNMAQNSAISIQITDNLSGIKTYRGTIDGKWVMMEYEAKKAILFHTFDALSKGNHTFELTVTDGVGNTAYVSIPFIR